MNQVKRRGGQPGPRPLKAFSILVRDERGDLLRVYERELSQRTPLSSSERKLTCYQLDSGKLVDMIDSRTFQDRLSGEKFVAVERSEVE